MNNKEKIKAAIELGIRYGQTDGAHHKTWVIDQMIRILAGVDYEKLIEESNWYTGIAP
jgi:hypothetical protein